MAAGRFILVVALLAAGCGGRPETIGFDGQALQDDVARYAEMGPHRSGGPGDIASRDWLAETLRANGFSVEVQAVEVDAWHHIAATLSIGDNDFNGFPLALPPTDPNMMTGEGPLRSADRAGPGDIALVELTPLLESATPQSEAELIRDALARGASGAILLTHTASGDAFAFNTRADDTPFSAPVIVVGSRHAEALHEARAAGAPVFVSLEGAYETVETWNVIGRLDRAGSETVVVSTPRTGWFDSAAERGPGLALFRALAGWASSTGEADLVFVGTGGHELAHVGMDRFLRTLAPAPADTRLWLHLGASIAAYGGREGTEEGCNAPDTENSEHRWIIYTADLAWRSLRSFSGLHHRHAPAFISTFGEAADLKAHGYGSFFALAGTHPRFHQRSDQPCNTGPELLEPRAEAVARMLRPDL